jgi:acyl-CoA hydrolase/GNAT superfamily N-acetyltransferase
MTVDSCGYIDDLRRRYPEKFVPLAGIFRHIHRGDHIFISTGCGEPQYMVNALTEYVKKNPKAFFDTEVLHMWTLGGAPYTNEDYRRNFRHNSFFPAWSTRDAVNVCQADYTPIFLSQVPDLIRRDIVTVDVALIQTSPPDSRGHMSLGVSVDIAKTAVENARLVVAQVNDQMPRVHGDTFLNIDRVDFIVHHDEPLLEYESSMSDEIAQRIGRYVARIVEDGDTIQVGPGSLPNAVIANLRDKRNLGVHTDLLTDGIVNLMKSGVVDNLKKNLNKGKTVATFCMGSKDTYEFIHDNPAVEFRTIDYTNNPMIIASHENMTSINSAFEMDLTGQASASSLGAIFYRGIGGQADFMRGAVLSKNGKSILALPSTAADETISRIVPSLKEGAGVTLIRGDAYYVVTEYGIAYLHGKNVRQRAMELISIAHPKFRPSLIEAARKLNLIYHDQAFILGDSGAYPEEFETYRTTKTGLEIFLRPVKISDEPLLKKFFYSLSDRSLYRRFVSARRDMPHERLQEFVAIDYSAELVILAVLKKEERETQILGIGQYGINVGTHTAEAAFVVHDDVQNKGIGTELCKYLTVLAKREGLLGFTADVLKENLPMLKLFHKMGFDIESSKDEEVFELRMMFRE